MRNKSSSSMLAGSSATLEASVNKQFKTRQALDDAVVSVQELDELLAQPLQAAFSRRFFTGIPSASLAAKPAAAKAPAGGQSQAAASAAADDPSASEATGSPCAETLPDRSQEVQRQEQQREREQSLKHTVALAQNLASSRQRAKVREVPSCWTMASMLVCLLRTL